MGDDEIEESIARHRREMRDMDRADVMRDRDKDEPDERRVNYRDHDEDDQ